MDTNKNPKVFISYSHESNKAFEQKIFKFAQDLRSEGIDAMVDLYEEAPSEGWPRWMENQIRKSDYVLVVVTKSYYDKMYNTPGKGVSWEVNLIYTLLYSTNAETTKFIPVFFSEGDDQYIPTPLKSFTYYNISNKEQYDNLYWRLRGVNTRVKPPLGPLRPLPEKEQKSSMLIATPIDLDLWNKAGWQGMVYLLQQGAIPTLGMLFNHYESAKKIFVNWKKDFKNHADDFLEIAYIEPPFPDKCSILDDEYGTRNGYFVHIGPNVEASLKHSLDSGIQTSYLTSISRYRWVDEQAGNTFRKLFEKMYKVCGRYELIPVGKKDIHGPLTEDNLIIGDEYAIELKKFSAESGEDVAKDPNNLHNVVFKKPVKDL